MKRVGRPRRGSIICVGKGRSKQYYARVRYTENGTQREMKRRCASASDAARTLESLMASVREREESYAEGRDDVTFEELANYFEATSLIPARYVGDRKVEGRRSLKTPRAQLKTLRAYFKREALRHITPARLEAFKAYRLKQPVVRAHRTADGTYRHVAHPRAIASVNHDLKLLRRMLNIARTQRWLKDNPFEMVRGIINVADEQQRETILSLNDEAQLLAAFTPRGYRVKAAVIVALDTACRMGELVNLKWSDVDLERGVLTVRAMNSKTSKARNVPLSARAVEALRAVWGRRDPASETVFEVREFRRTYERARARAGLSHVRFHDLRHTAATRLVRGGLPLAEVGRVLGHTQPATTYRYVNADNDTINRARAIMDKLGTDSTKD